MGRTVLLAQTAVAVAAAPGVAIAAVAASPPKAGHARISVTPATGGPRTRFVVSFRAPDPTGRFGAMQRRYLLTATTTPKPHCIRSVPISLPPTRAHALIRTTLDPKRLGGKWCAGTFHGQVKELESPYCPSVMACPAFVVLLGTVGRFSFHVSAPAKGRVDRRDVVPRY